MSRADLATLVQNISSKLQHGETAAAGLLLDLLPEHALFAPLRGLHAYLSGDATRALDYYQQAAAAGLNLPDLPYQQAQALLTLNRTDEALALLAHDNSRTALLLQEEALAKQKKFTAAAARARQLIALGDRRPQVITNYLASSAKVCDWSADVNEVLASCTDHELSPGILVFFEDDPARLNRVAKLTAANYPRMAARPTRAPRHNRRLKVGYLSDDFRHHATAYLMAELFSLHDRTQFECYAFSYGLNDGSAIRTRLEKTAEHFVDLAGQPALAVHHALHDAELDILVDLKGHAQNNLLPWLATRPAPLQVHWLGFPGPTAAPFIDYNITDAIVTPPDAPFADQILPLPDCCYQLNDRQRTSATLRPRAAYGLPEQAVIFGSFNHTGKIRPAWFEVMLQLLAQNPQLILWQYAETSEAENNLRAYGAARGLRHEQLLFTGPMPHDEHLARMAVCDLMPDTFPCGGHTTTSEALWMNLPVITLAGATFASRVSASLLQHVGLPQLITTNVADYRKLLQSLIDDTAARQQLRQYLQQAKSSAPLFNSPRWVGIFENTLQQAYDKVTAA